MSLIRFDNQTPSLFDRFFENDFFDWSNKNFSNTNTTLPAVNIKADENGYEVEMSAPGFDKNDFKIEINNNVLCISSEKEVENEIKEGQTFTARDFTYHSLGPFSTLPNLVKGIKIIPRYDIEILKVNFLKK